MQLFLATGGQIRQTPNGLKTDVFLEKFRRFFFQKAFEQSHQGENLTLGTLPVLGRKSVEGQEFDLQFAAGFHAGTHGFRSFFVTFDSGQTAALRPTTVAIHDNRDMTRDEFRRRGHSVQRIMVSFRVGPTLTIRNGAPVNFAIART